MNDAFFSEDINGVNWEFQNYFSGILNFFRSFLIFSLALPDVGWPSLFFRLPGRSFYVFPFVVTFIFVCSEAYTYCTHFSKYISFLHICSICQEHWIGIIKLHKIVIISIFVLYVHFFRLYWNFNLVVHSWFFWSVTRRKENITFRIHSWFLRSIDSK